jgi:hypothetical protein
MALYILIFIFLQGREEAKEIQSWMKASDSQI